MTSDGSGFEGIIIYQRDGAVVRCRGEIDMAAAEGFRSLLDQAMTRSSSVVVDLGGVTFLDSSGLRALAVSAVRAGGSLAIRNPTPPVARVLELSKMDQFISTEATRERVHVEP